MTKEARLREYEAEVTRLMNAAYESKISQIEMQDEIDDLVHPLVNKRPADCLPDERAIISTWFKEQGDKHMRAAESALPGITANPGVGSVQ